MNLVGCTVSLPRTPTSPPPPNPSSSSGQSPARQQDTAAIPDYAHDSGWPIGCHRMQSTHAVCFLFFGFHGFSCGAAALSSEILSQ